jgi:hypothetical protein
VVRLSGQRSDVVAERGVAVSGAVFIEGVSLASLIPMGGIGDRSIGLDINMTNRQVRDAILNLIGGMPEQEAYEWLRGEFPAWFKVSE